MMAVRQSGRSAPAPAPTVAGVRWVSVTSVALLLAALRIALVVTLPYDRVLGLFDDDAFYYFGIARHIAAGDGSTFNGLDPTNGYHPLWTLLLVPIFGALSGRAALVAVVVLSTLVFVASARLIDRMSAGSIRPGATLAGSAPLLLAGATGPSFFFSGMETGLLLMCLLALAMLYVRTDGLRADWFGPRHALGLGVLLSITVLARLDAVFTMALVALLALIAWRRRGARTVARLAVATAMAPILLIGGYLVVNMAVFSTPVPVSGQAKALGDGTNFGVVIQFLSAPVVIGASLWWGALSIVVVPAAVLVGRRTRELLSPDIAVFALVVLAGGLLTVAYFGFTSSWQLWPWYFSAAPLAIALGSPELVNLLPKRIVSIVAVLAAVLVVGTVGIRAVTLLRADAGQSGRGDSAFVEQGPVVAAEVAALAPPGVPLAMGDRAGSFGFHLDRPLVHLEGLVESVDYLDALNTGRVPAFLASHGVGLYARADNDPGRPVLGGDPGCRGFVEPTQGHGPKFSVVVCDADLLLNHPLADGAYRIWMYRPALNP